MGEYGNFMRRERARIEREDRERAEARAEARQQAEREHFAPLLAAQNPIRLVIVYKKSERGFRAEIVGLSYACEAGTQESAREGVLDLVRRQARRYPKEVLEATRAMADAEVVSVDVSARRARTSSSTKK